MKTPALCLSVALFGCSSLDPNVGPLRVDQPVTEDAGADDAPPGTVSFSRDIRPLLMRTREQAVAMGAARGCVPCHLKASMGTGALLSGFDVSTLRELRKGGGSTEGYIIVPGNPDLSLMVKALRGQLVSNRMPKGGPQAQYWTDDSEEMRLLTTWIKEGARGADSE
jgi:hypothetical protein